MTEMEEHGFNTIIVITPSDCERLAHLYPRIIDNLVLGRLCFVGAPEIEDILKKDKKIHDLTKVIDENSIISFAEVNNCLSKRMEDILRGREMPRAVTGWYYQQFLKMQYSAICEDDYYMVWDGDTIPCRKISMFQEGTGKPYLDLKHEYHPQYFDTISKILPGFKKVIQRSFISEHMLIKKDIMQNLISDIEKNDQIKGEKFWEKIINSIPPEKITESSFSEFETYGTYVALRYPSVYSLRDWHSFRLGSQFFDKDTISDRDFEWLAKDFDAISFEKNQQMIGDGNTFFNDPYYQEKLSAKQMLQAIQMEFNGGYKEVWADDPVTMKNANVKKGVFENSKGVDNRTLFVIVSDGNEELLKQSVEGIKNSLSETNYKIEITDPKLPYYKAINTVIKSCEGSEYQDWDVYIIKAGTVVVYDSIHFLKQAIYSSDEVGAAGSVSNLAANKQRLDVHFDTPEEYIAFGEKNNVLMECPYLERVSLSSNGLLIRRETFEKAGLFDEKYEFCCLSGDADYSIRLLENGYRLRLVRNSFVFRLVWDEKEDYIEENSPIADFLYVNSNAFAQIPFRETEKFNVLEIGCGLGANLKAIRSLYENAKVVGVEKNKELCKIAEKTEKVFATLDELRKENDGVMFDILLISEKDFNTMSDEEKAVIGTRCCADFKVIAK
ncbi:DUF6492 family protein [Butyrivibrio sp. YAB3001]|uniref:DUF6492 family protein n=1 Tax=Butyrivibrio sp. YAB3001 TaxID=1520812 RepID=UPI0015880506|nr:DUF6492 family protein [Butyrivibrio sp. YAB3001]